VIYGIRWNGDGAGLGGFLYTIDPFSGLAVEVGNTGSCTEGGLAFAPDGTLYFAGYTDCSFTTTALRVLNPATAATVSSTPLASGLLYDGLAVRPTDGAVFASRGDALYLIDPETGVEVFWGRSEAGVVTDLAFR
jgi:outer membrane protein assembly factor BamB